MAIELASKTNVDLSDPDYEYGSIVDDTGIGDGTPVDKQVYGDFHQFFARLLAQAVIPPNNLPDNYTNGYQYMDALVQVITDVGNDFGVAGWNKTANPGMTIIPFKWNRINYDNPLVLITARTFTYDFTDAKLGAKFRLHVPVNLSLALTFPVATGSRTLKLNGSSFGAAFGPNVINEAMIEFTYQGLDNDLQHVVTVQVYTK